MALIYAEIGTMAFAPLASLLTDADGSGHLLVWTGIALVITGVGFKLAVVPFHMWTPDVYEGAPAPVTAFIATVSKGAMVALLLRLFVQLGGTQNSSLVLLFSLIAVASMGVGNVLALLQVNVKRLLAYSSIAHLGYMLVALVASGALGVEALTYYLVIYILTTLGAFGVVTALSTPRREAETFEDYRGLAWQRPGLAVVLTVALFSLAGIPLTAGFVGKFYVLMSGIESGLWLLVVIFVLNSAMGLYYYLRLVVTLYLPRPESAPPPTAMGASSGTRLAGTALAAVVVLLVGLGVYPLPLMRLIRHTVTDLM
jgi:NADH-quinone oxidoreductase subunit N